MASNQSELEKLRIYFNQVLDDEKTCFEMPNACIIRKGVRILCKRIKKNYDMFDMVPVPHGSVAEGTNIRKSDYDFLLVLKKFVNQVDVSKVGRQLKIKMKYDADKLKLEHINLQFFRENSLNTFQTQCFFVSFVTRTLEKKSIKVHDPDSDYELEITKILHTNPLTLAATWQSKDKSKVHHIDIDLTLAIVSTGKLPEGCYTKDPMGNEVDKLLVIAFLPSPTESTTLMETSAICKLPSCYRLAIKVCKLFYKEKQDESISSYKIKNLVLWIRSDEDFHSQLSFVEQFNQTANWENVQKICTKVDEIIRKAQKLWFLRTEDCKPSIESVSDTEQEQIEQTQQGRKMGEYCTVLSSQLK